MNRNRQRVWVLGHGFLGRALADRCRAAGDFVLCIDSAAETLPDMCADAASPATLAQATEQGGGEPAAVFCCMATHGGSIEAYRHCYGDTVAALLAAGLGQRCVFCSSTSLYGGVSERTAILAAAEEAVLAAGGCVARLAPLYGKGRCELLRRHLAGEPRLAGSPQRVLNYLHVQDAAAALLLLAKQRVGGLYAVCGDSLTKAAAYALLESLTRIPAAVADAAPGKRTGSSQAVDTAALRALGWQPQHCLADFIRQAVSPGV